jgi:pimeloyl-ACP methyl ester carboxylesterase
MTVRPIEPETLRGWTEGLISSPAIRRDVRRYVETTPEAPLVEAASKLRTFDRPTLVIWATDDRTMPRRHGRELAELIPQASLIEFEDCSVLMPLDQPLRLASEIRSFVAALPSSI